MPERIEWLEDGTAGGSPYSPRFGDRYRSELGGLEQAGEVFLKGCGLPAAWADWMKQQTMLVNENRLNLADARARQYLARQMENHFFGSGADKVQGYVPPTE